MFGIMSWEDIPVPDCLACPNVLICPQKYVGPAWCVSCHNVTWIVNLYGRECYSVSEQILAVHHRGYHKIIMPHNTTLFVREFIGEGCRNGSAVSQQSFSPHGVLRLAGCDTCTPRFCAGLRAAGYYNGRQYYYTQLFEAAWNSGKVGMDTWDLREGQLEEVCPKHPK